MPPRLHGDDPSALDDPHLSGKGHQHLHGHGEEVDRHRLREGELRHPNLEGHCEERRQQAEQVEQHEGNGTGNATGSEQIPQPLHQLDELRSHPPK